MTTHNRIHELAEKIVTAINKGVAVQISDDYSLYDDEINVLGTNLHVQVGSFGSYYSVNESGDDYVVFNDVEDEFEVIAKIKELLAAKAKYS